MPRPGSLDTAVTCLWIVTPFTATLSLAIVCVAITTNQWLHTEEKMPNPNYNGTGDRDYLSKRTVSGLWTLCYTNPGEWDLQCFNIEYFPREEYSPDPNDSTMAIPYAVTRSALFFILATLLLFFGEFCCVCGHFARHRRLLTFIAGVAFIISGLLMLIGLVMYISIFKAEIGSKLRPRSQLQPPMFTFRYGYSFLLYVSGFITIETAGTCAVFLYIYWTQKDWTKKRLELQAMNHRRKMSNSSLMLNIDQQMFTAPLYPCQRHPYCPQPILDNHMDAISPVLLQRRVYLDSERESPQLSPKLKVSSVSQTYFAYTPDTPVDPYQHEAYSGQWDVPRDITTQTVSTTADINSTMDDIGDYSPHPEFITFDLDDIPPLRTPDSRRKDFDTLRRTTPV